MSKYLVLFLLACVGMGSVQAQSSLQKSIDKKDYKAVQQWNGEVNQPFVSEGQSLTALSYAAIQGDAEMLGLLLKKGAKVNQITDGRDALMFAAKGGNMECVQILLNSGADAMNESREGLTARDYAVQAGHTDVSLLLDNQMKKAIEQMKASKKSKK